MPEQNNVYQFPNTPHNPNSEENINDSLKKSIDKNLLDNGGCVEIDFHRASENALPFELLKEIQEKQSDVDAAYSMLDSNLDIVDSSVRLHETMDLVDFPDYLSIKEQSVKIFDIRQGYLKDTIGVPDHLKPMLKGKSIKNKRAA